MTQELRDKEYAVLQAVHDGANTVSEIKEQTTLTSREINYSLTEYSLEQLGLVEIRRSKGREWRKINGTERYVWKPKTVELTDKGLQTLAGHNPDQGGYEDWSRRELIHRIQELEERQDRLETVFKDFREKVMQRI